jgi:hypothetical protein
MGNWALGIGHWALGIGHLTKNFKGGTRHVIYPWNQSQIENRKSSRKSIYLAQVNLKSKI